MLLDNGGEVSTAECDWGLYPIKVSSDKKRLSRTCYHIISETESCRDIGCFPEAALAMARNGLGYQIVFIRVNGKYLSTVYLWFHETGELTKLASTFNEIGMVNKYIKIRSTLL